MATTLDTELRTRLAAIGQAHGLRLLILFGSRARGDSGPASDWDFGYLATNDPDALALTADLARAVGLVRIHAAQDGNALFEGAVEAFDYRELDVGKVFDAATKGPADLRAFIRLIRDQWSGQEP